MPPRVSVIIPCYAQAHFLGEALDSVLAQRLPAHEIIVVDDGSPDRVGDVVARYPGVRLVAQENRGLSGARNRGLEESSGEFVVCLDADDRLLPNALEAGARALEAHPDCAFVWGGRRLIDAAGQPLPGKVLLVNGKAHYDRLLLENVIGPPVGVMFRRSVLRELGGFSEQQRYGEDYELYLRVTQRHPTWCHRELIAEYRVHDANMSRNRREMLAGVLRALELQEEFVAGDPARRRTLAKGRRRAWLREDGSFRLDELSRHTREGRWLKVAGDALVLLFKYPTLFLPNFGRWLRNRIRLEPGGQG